MVQLSNIFLSLQKRDVVVAAPVCYGNNTRMVFSSLCNVAKVTKTIKNSSKSCEKDFQ